DLHGNLGDRCADADGDMFARHHLDFIAAWSLDQVVYLGDMDRPAEPILRDLDVEAAHQPGLRCQRRKESVVQRPEEAVDLELLASLFPDHLTQVAHSVQISVVLVLDEWDAMV